MLLIVDLILLPVCQGGVDINSPSFSRYKNNIIIKESRAISVWISDSTLIKEICIL
jgi:hypothetical protein